MIATMYLVKAWVQIRMHMQLKKYFSKIYPLSIRATMMEAAANIVFNVNEK
jgi:hypothetical protein